MNSKTQRCLSIAIEQQMINKLIINVNKLSEIKKIFNLYSQNNGCIIINGKKRNNKKIINI